MRVLSLILIIGGICWGSLSGIAAERSSVPNSRALYHEMALAGTIDYAVFERAIAGYNRMGGHDKDILTVIDFTKPSTENTYYGKNGYSLVLDGLERGINDKAKERAIVMHGATYADPSTIRSCGRLGRSLGCPALPLAVSKKIIDTIKGGTLLYIHGDDKTYASRSTFIKQDEIRKDRADI